MTRKRRYLIVAGILAGCLAIVLSVLSMLPAAPGVTKANFDRIRIGMTLQEAQGILGEEGGFFDGGTPIDPKTNTLPPFSWPHANGMVAIVVQFNNETVSSKDFFESTETIPDKLRRWLGLAK